MLLATVIALTPVLVLWVVALLAAKRNEKKVRG